MVPQLTMGLGPIGTVSAASVDPKTRATRTPAVATRPVDGAWPWRRPQGLRSAHRQAGFGP